MGRAPARIAAAIHGCCKASRQPPAPATVTEARLLDTDSDDLADRTRDLMDALEDGPDFLDSFDAELFDALVEKIIVDSTERLRFRLKNGLELTEQIERTKR